MGNRTKGVAVAASAAAVVALYVYAFDAPTPHAVLLGVVLLVASPYFAFTSLGLILTLVLVYSLLLNAAPATLPGHQAFLVGETVCALLLTWKGLLVRAQTPRPGVRGVMARWRRGVFLIAGVPFLAALLFRCFSPITASCWSALLLMVYGGLRPPGAVIRLSWKRALTNVCLLAVSTALALLSIEAVLRVVLPPAGPFRFYEHHPECLFLPKPGAGGAVSVQISETEFRRMAFNISSQGLRDHVYGPKEPDEFRILMLGDSFTMGAAVPEEYSIPRQLERLLESAVPGRRIRVINAGCSGGGPVQERVLFFERGLPLEPDLVIMQFLAVNDFNDALAPFGKTLRAFDAFDQDSAIYWGKNDFFPFRAERWLLQRSRVYRAVMKLAGRRKLATEFLHELRICPPFEIPRLPHNENRPPGLEADLCEWYPELKEALTILEQNTAMIREECRNRHIGLLAYCVPVAHDVNDVQWNNETAPLDHALAYERNKGTHEIELAMWRQAIPTFSVLDALKAQPDLRRLYYLQDGHFTEFGNQLVARRIRDELMTRYFPKIGLAPPNGQTQEVKDEG